MSNKNKWIDRSITIFVVVFAIPSSVSMITGGLFPIGMLFGALFNDGEAQLIFLSIGIVSGMAGIIGWKLVSKGLIDHDDLPVFAIVESLIIFVAAGIIWLLFG